MIARSSFVLVLDTVTPELCCPGYIGRATSIVRRDMGVVVFIVLTVAIFGLLGLVQRLVERL